MTSDTTAPGFREFICLIAALTAITAFSIDALLPALSAMGTSLAVQDMRNTQFLVTIFIAGMVFGELLFGPLSDAIGRKRTIVIGLLIYAIGSVTTLTAQTFEVALIGRCIQGFGVSGPKIATRALIRDLYEGEAMARIMSLVFTLFILVPMIAPAIGQLTIQLFDWRAIFVLYIVFAVVTGLWMLLRQPETLPIVNRIPLNLFAMARNGGMVLLHRRVMLCTVAGGLLFGGQLLFLSVAQAVFVDVYNVSDKFPLYFAILAVALGGAAFANSSLVVRYGMFTVARTALCFMTAFSLTYLGCAGWYAGAPPLPLFMFCCFSVFSCVGLLIGNISAMAMQSLGLLAGLGASVMAAISSAIAFTFASIIGRFYDQGVTVMGCGFFLASSIGLVLITGSRKLDLAPITPVGVLVSR